MNSLKLEITGKAYNDIEIISDYIARDNKNAAIKFVELFKKLLKHYANIQISGNPEEISHILM